MPLNLECVLNRVIAIDGPSASGKSTVARRVAGALGFLYVDSGALYRTVTWAVLKVGIEPAAEPAVSQLLERLDVQLFADGGAVVVESEGERPGSELRSAAVRENVSDIAAMPAVRAFVTERLRALRGMGSLVMEGRDIGSVVFPDTPHKFYLNAAPEERARRRRIDFVAQNERADLGGVLAGLSARDKKDSTRVTAPLSVPPGACVIDTTGMDIEDVVSEILMQVREEQARQDVSS